MLSASLTSELWIAPTLSYIAVFLGVFLVVKTLIQPYTQTNIPPFPVRPYPILGHLPYIAKGQRAKLNEFRKMTGDIYSLYFGSQLFVIVNGTRLLKEALVKQGATLNDRPPQAYIEGGDMGLVFANGPLWKEQRAVSLAIFKSFGMGKSSLAQKMRAELDAYLDTLAALKGKPEDVHTLTSTSVANIICSIIVGNRFEYTDPLFVDFVENFGRQVAEFENISPVVIWPWLRFIPGNFMGAKTLDRSIKVFLSKFWTIQARSLKINFSESKGGEESNRKLSQNAVCAENNNRPRRLEQAWDSLSFRFARLLFPSKLTVYMSVWLSVCLAGDHLRRILQQMFIAGTDTTATTVLWFMAFMVNYPDIQQKVRCDLKYRKY
ncbi:cytochrome p450 2u1 [Plakobranchus ocellatus]|uniref:Cytochrome p450 2u1 n=1 Tax=Plakobranchus ocellatus TaxID=259542 RepID=A0AAV4BNF5_9GAST|nr:cytochrome p450 2u1 [Plakobranchus ocellatus]